MTLSFFTPYPMEASLLAVKSFIVKLECVIPSGVNIFSFTSCDHVSPVSFSSIAPSVMNIQLLYCHLDLTGAVGSRYFILRSRLSLDSEGNKYHEKSCRGNPVLWHNISR